jgi:hypothetical protein
MVRLGIRLFHFNTGGLGIVFLVVGLDFCFSLVYSL